MHAASIPIANISEPMGQTIGVNLKSYARFKPHESVDLVTAVNLWLTSRACELDEHASQ